MFVFLWFLLVFGLTYLLCASAIFSIPRKFLKAFSGFFHGVLSCAPCTSFWVGLVLGLDGAHFVLPWVDYLLCKNTICLMVIDHLYGGVLSIGAVSSFQFLAKIVIAEVDE